MAHNGPRTSVISREMPLHLDDPVPHAGVGTETVSPTRR
jgi:hypothetical protein